MVTYRPPSWRTQQPHSSCIHISFVHCFARIKKFTETNPTPKGKDRKGDAQLIHLNTSKKFSSYCCQDKCQKNGVEKTSCQISKTHVSKMSSQISKNKDLDKEHSTGFSAPWPYHRRVLQQSSLWFFKLLKLFKKNSREGRKKTTA